MNVRFSQFAISLILAVFLCACQLQEMSSATTDTGPGDGPPPPTFNGVPFAFHNTSLAFDVNADGLVTNVDILDIVSFLRDHGTSRLPELADPDDVLLFADVDRDGWISLIDVHLVIIYHRLRAGDEFLPDTPSAEDILAANVEAAATLDEDYGFGQPDASRFNSLGRFERWLPCADGSWVAIVPEGILFRINTAGTLGSVIGKFDPMYYEDPSLFSL